MTPSGGLTWPPHIRTPMCSLAHQAGTCGVCTPLLGPFPHTWHRPGTQVAGTSVHLPMRGAAQSVVRAQTLAPRPIALTSQPCQVPAGDPEPVPSCACFLACNTETVIRSGCSAGPLPTR